MKYTIQRTDGRHSHNDLFRFYIGFSRNLHSNFGPACFNHCVKWFIETYGYSAEVGHYKEIKQYFDTMSQLGISPSKEHADLTGTSLCNPKWSWTIGYNDLRIYVANSQELAFFQLSHPVDQ